MKTMDLKSKLSWLKERNYRVRHNDFGWWVDGPHFWLTGYVATRSEAINLGYLIVQRAEFRRLVTNERVS